MNITFYSTSLTTNTSSCWRLLTIDIRICPVTSITITISAPKFYIICATFRSSKFLIVITRSFVVPFSTNFNARVATCIVRSYHNARIIFSFVLSFFYSVITTMVILNRPVSNSLIFYSIFISVISFPNNFSNVFVVNESNYSVSS